MSGERKKIKKIGRKIWIRAKSMYLCTRFECKALFGRREEMREARG
jgi:hypothetical protein